MSTVFVNFGFQTAAIRANWPIDNFGSIIFKNEDIGKKEMQFSYQKRLCFLNAQSLRSKSAVLFVTLPHLELMCYQLLRRGLPNVMLLIELKGLPGIYTL